MPLNQRGVHFSNTQTCKFILVWDIGIYTKSLYFQHVFSITIRCTSRYAQGKNEIEVTKESLICIQLNIFQYLCDNSFHFDNINMKFYRGMVKLHCWKILVLFWRHLYHRPFTSLAANVIEDNLFIRNVPRNKNRGGFEIMSWDIKSVL